MRCILSLLLLLTLPMMGFANDASVPDFITAQIPTAQKMGKSRLRYLFFDVYDATLYAPKGVYTDKGDAALSLHYLRRLNGRAIADRTRDEIKHQGVTDDASLAHWYKIATDIFPDVDAQTTLTALRRNGQMTLFNNGKKIATVTDTGFVSHFFAIWLGARTTEPAMRDELLQR